MKFLKANILPLVVFIIAIPLAVKLFCSMHYKETRCGIVIDKKQADHLSIHKYNADIEVFNYLYVKYGNYVEQQEVVADTYYKHDIGSKVCFDKNIESDYSIIFFILAMILSVSCVFSLAYLIAYLLEPLF